MKPSVTKSSALNQAVWLFVLLMAMHAWIGHATQALYYFPAVIIILWKFRDKNLQNLFLPLLLVWLSAVFDSLGNAKGWYGGVPWYDSFTHAFTIGAFTLFLTPLLRQAYFPENGLRAATMAALASVALGALYEILEYWAEILFNVQVITEKYDSPKDLQWDFAGAAMALIILFISARFRKTGHMEK